MVKVLTIGSATQDIIIEYQEGIQVTINKSGKPYIAWPEGSKIKVQKLHYASGGGATNSAASFAQLGCGTSCFFKVGDDAAGKAIREDVAQRGITVHHAISEQEETGSSFVIPTTKKDRIIFAYRGANQTIKEADVPEEIFGEHDCLYITSLSNEAANVLPHIAYEAQERIQKTGIKVAVNPGASQLKKNSRTLKAALAHIDVLILNTEEMKQFMHTLKPQHSKSAGIGIVPDGPLLMRSILTFKESTFTLQEYFKEIFSYGVKRIVVTDGKEGVYVATKDSIYFHPALQVELINSLGAGDAFGSCFVANLLLGRKLEDAIRCGILNASSVVMHHDAKSGLLSQAELDQFLQSLDNNLLQTYTRVSS